MFYLMMHSKHFNRLYGVGHIVKDHSDNERGNLLPPLLGLLFSISNKGFYIHHSTDRIAHTTSIGSLSFALGGVIIVVHHCHDSNTKTCILFEH